MADVTVTRQVWALIVDGEIADVSTHPTPLHNRARREYHAGRSAYVMPATVTATVDPRSERS